MLGSSCWILPDQEHCTNTETHTEETSIVPGIIPQIFWKTSGLFLLCVLDLPPQLQMKAKCMLDLHIWPKPWMLRQALSRKLYSFWMNTWISYLTLFNQSSCASHQAQTCSNGVYSPLGMWPMLHMLFLVISVSRKWIWPKPSSWFSLPHGVHVP